MRKMFTPLDDMLIERLFQPASDMITHRIGVDRNRTACFCINLASLAWIVSRTQGLSDAALAGQSGTACLDLLLLLLGLVALLSLRTLFRRARQNYRNPLRPAMRPHRAIVLLMLAARLLQSPVPNLANAADIAMLVFAASALYLGACTERPPERRGVAALAPAA
jgi:hypothetical protein